MAHERQENKNPFLINITLDGTPIRLVEFEEVRDRLHEAQYIVKNEKEFPYFIVREASDPIRNAKQMINAHPDQETREILNKLIFGDS